MPITNTSTAFAPSPFCAYLRQKTITVATGIQAQQLEATPKPAVKRPAHLLRLVKVAFADARLHLCRHILKCLVSDTPYLLPQRVQGDDLSVPNAHTLLLTRSVMLVRARGDAGLTEPEPDRPVPELPKTFHGLT